MRVLFVSAFVAPVTGHGGLSAPLAREATVTRWFNEGCQIGCDECVGHKKSVCQFHSMKPTIDPELLTYELGYVYPSKYNPWFAPGFAPVFSPCGLAGGQRDASIDECGCVPPAGYEVGFDGRNIQDAPITEWPIGSLQEVSWWIAANHGGGYAVRLCPISADMTEDCFQSHHLPFAGDSSWIQFNRNPSNRTEIRANRTTQGTNPTGSQWTKVPIPSCSGPAGGGLTCSGCDKPMFESPIPGLWGEGATNGCAGCDPSKPTPQDICNQVMDFEIIDKVQVPDLPVGDYALSFRWDCEQSPQIWTQCSNIKITSDAVV